MQKGSKKMRFLVTGGGGYLGTVLVPLLLKEGHSIKVVDRFFWGTELFKPFKNNVNLELITADTRSVNAKHFKNIDVVIDLAALSNDPISELEQEKTMEINYRARVRTATLAKQHGAQKYILASSCSVYGFRDGVVDEASSLAPVTTYARANVLAEENVFPLNDKNFAVVALRQGTLYGLSPRMRFDIALNTMTLALFQNHTISVSGGSQWRPIVHVEDSARAFLQVATTDNKIVGGQVFNVGSDAQNYQIADLATAVQKAIKEERDSQILINEIQSDFRSYRASFDKIKRVLGYKTLKTPADGTQEVYGALKTARVRSTPETKTIDWYKHLLAKNPKILEDLKA